MESQVELRRKRRNPRWNSAGNQGIPDGAQLEAKGFKMESQMELRWSSDGAQMEAKESKEAKIDSK